MLVRIQEAANTRLFWLLVSLVISVAVAIANLFALQYFLYWRIWWFDIPMHVAGGFAIGAFLVGFFDVKRPLMFLSLIAAISIGWEIIEYIAGLTRYEQGYVLDTAHDLLDDTVGAVLAYLLARISIWR